MHVTLQHFFQPSWVHFRTFTGWMVSLSNLINGLASALYLMYVVRPYPIPTAAHASCIAQQALGSVRGRAAMTAHVVAQQHTESTQSDAGAKSKEVP